MTKKETINKAVETATESSGVFTSKNLKASAGGIAYSIIFKFVVKYAGAYWQLITIGILAGLLYLCNNSSIRSNSLLQEQLSNSEIQYQNLQQILKMQNDKITKFESDTLEKNKKALTSRDKIKTLSDNVLVLTNQISSEKKLKTCDDAIDWLRKKGPTFK